VINAAAGIQRFGVGLPPQQIVPRQEGNDAVAQAHDGDNGEQQQ